MHVATVIPISKGVPFDVLSYYASDAYAPGTLVSIPLGNKLIIGLVFETVPLHEAKGLVKSSTFSLRKIKQALGHLPYFENIMKAVENTSNLTLSPVGAISGSVTPNFLFEYINSEKINDIFNFKKEDSRNTIFVESVVIGKEVDRLDKYKRTVRENFANKKSVMFVCPTIRDLEKWKKMLEKGIGKHVVILHSKTTKKNLRSYFSLIKSSETPLLIFATPGFFVIPRGDIGAVIAEDESSNLYKTGDRFATDLRIFVREFCINANIELIWGDILPRFETLERLKADHLPRSFVPSKLHLVETQYYRTVLPTEAVDLIAHAQKKKHKIFIYTNRKGIAPISRCADCSTIVDCPDCKLPMVLKNRTVASSNGNQNERYFICNHCGGTLPPEHLCTHCGSWNITPLAIGTESLRNEIISIVGADNVIAIDDDLTPDSKMLDSVVAEIEKRKFVIVVGTIKALPYIKGVKYTMMPFFDRMLSTPSPYTTESILRLVMTCDEKSSDGVIVCTRNPKFPFTKELAEQKINAIIHDELAVRKDLSYPPFGAIIKISITVPIGYRAEIKQSVEKYFKDDEFVSMPARRISLGSMKVLMVWIIKAESNFIEERGSDVRDFLESLRFPYRIEQNPERF